MNKVFHFAVMILYVFLTACNTLYNSRLINLEIVEPAKVIFPPEYKTLAIRYNNSNISYNPDFANYVLNDKNLKDGSNSDSVASFAYYKSFAETLENSFLFDSIVKVEPGNFSSTKFEVADSILADTLFNRNAPNSIKAVKILAELQSKYTPQPEYPNEIIHIDPKLGLYSAEDLKRINDTTGANLLLSLDYYGQFERVVDSDWQHIMISYVVSLWNFYDLQTRELKYSYNLTDTVPARPDNFPKFNPRELSVSYIPEVSGNNFANFLAPHWVEVQRTFYKSGQIELKKAEQLAEENKWLEAAEIWKKNVTNVNKNVAAKSMFNLALACEIEGELDAALDWVVKSYYVFKDDNDVHQFNCKEYIRIIGIRKMDIQKIELQVNQNSAFQ